MKLDPGELTQAAAAAAAMQSAAQYCKEKGSISAGTPCHLAAELYHRGPAANSGEVGGEIAGCKRSAFLLLGIKHFIEN